MEAFKNYYRHSASCGQKVRNLYGKMMRTKTVDASFFDTQLSRCLKLVDIVFLGTGHMIGSGIYVLTGEVAKQAAGPALLISYILSGFAAFLSSLCYAEFGGRVPKAGSAYSYGYVTIGEFWAFIIGWDMLLENMIGAAALAVAWSGYVNSMSDNWLYKEMDKFSSIGYTHGILGSRVNLIAAGLILVVSVFMGLGANISAKFNSFFAVLNLIVIAFTVTYGLTFAMPDYWTNPTVCASEIANCTYSSIEHICSSKLAGCLNHTLTSVTTGTCRSGDAFMPFGFNGVVGGAAKVFFSYVGFESIASAGEETINPQRTIPLGTLLAMVIVTVAYMLMSTTLTLMIPFCTIVPDSAFASAFEARKAIWAKYVVAAGALSGMTTVLFGSLFSTPRGVYAMSMDGLLCRCLGYVHKKSQTPLVGVVLFGIISALIAMFCNLDMLAEFINIGTLMAYSIVACSVIVLRYKPGAPGSGDPLDSTEKSPSIATIPSLTDRGEAPRFGLLKERFASLEPLIGNPEPGATVNQTVGFMVIFMFCLAAILQLGLTPFVTWWAILLIVLLSIAILICLFIVFAHEQNTVGIIAFKVPFVPFVPALSLLLNIIFMFHLEFLTWIRFLIWLIIGAVIYFTYGIWNSKEKDQWDVDDNKISSFSNVETLDLKPQGENPNSRRKIGHQLPDYDSIQMNGAGPNANDHVTYLNIDPEEMFSRKRKL